MKWDFKMDVLIVEWS